MEYVFRCQRVIFRMLLLMFSTRIGDAQVRQVWSLIQAYAVFTCGRQIDKVILILLYRRLLGTHRIAPVPSLMWIPTCGVNSFTWSNFIMTITTIRYRNTCTNTVFFFRCPFRPINRYRYTFRCQLRFHFNFMLPLNCRRCFIRVSPNSSEEIIMILTGRFPRISFTIVSVAQHVKRGICGKGLFPYRRARLITRLRRNVILQVIKSTSGVNSRLFRRRRISPIRLIYRHKACKLLILVTASATRFVKLSIRRRALVSIRPRPTRDNMVVTLIRRNFNLAITRNYFCTMRTKHFEDPRFEFRRQNYLITRDMNFSNF